MITNLYLTLPGMKLSCSMLLKCGSDRDLKLHLALAGDAASKGQSPLQRLPEPSHSQRTSS